MASLGQVTLPNEIYGKTLGLPQIFGVESRDLTKTQISHRREEISHTKQDDDDPESDIIEPLDAIISVV